LQAVPEKLEKIISENLTNAEARKESMHGKPNNGTREK